MSSRHDPLAGKDGREIIRLMMPVYYTEEPITADEHFFAEQAWQKIISNDAPAYAAYCAESPEFAEKYPSCIRFFSDCFYGRLFDVHPLSRPLFRDLTSQGKFLVKMITLSLSELTDPAKFENILVRLAEVHNHRGVKAVECKCRPVRLPSFLHPLFCSPSFDDIDGIVGEVLLWALRRCLGPDAFTSEVHVAWLKIYSRMLRIMVPVAVCYERQLNAEALKADSSRAISNFNERRNIHAQSRILADFIDPRILNTTDAIIESLVQNNQESIRVAQSAKSITD